MRTGSVLNLNGEAVRVLSVFGSEVLLEIIRTRNVCVEPLKAVSFAPPTQYVQRSPEEGKTKRRKPTRSRISLYLLSLGNKTYKIGISKNLKKRMRKLQTALFDRPELVKSWDMACDHARASETAIKRQITECGWRGHAGTEVFQSVTHASALRMVEGCLVR